MGAFFSSLFESDRPPEEGKRPSKSNLKGGCEINKPQFIYRVELPVENCLLSSHDHISQEVSLESPQKKPIDCVSCSADGEYLSYSCGTPLIVIHVPTFRVVCERNIQDNVKCMKICSGSESSQQGRQRSLSGGTGGIPTSVNFLYVGLLSGQILQVCFTGNNVVSNNSNRKVMTTTTTTNIEGGGVLGEGVINVLKEGYCINSLDVSWNQGLLAFTTLNNKVGLYDLQKKSLVYLKNKATSVDLVCFNPSNDQLIATSHDHLTQIFDSISGNLVKMICPVTDVAMFPGKTYLMYGLNLTKITGASSSIASENKNNNTSDGTNVSYSSDVVTSKDDNVSVVVDNNVKIFVAEKKGDESDVYVWDLDTEKVHCKLKISDCNNILTTNGNLFFYDFIKAIHFKYKEKKSSPLKCHEDDILCLSTCNAYFISASFDGLLIIHYFKTLGDVMFTKQQNNYDIFCHSQ